MYFKKLTSFNLSLLISILIAAQILFIFLLPSYRQTLCLYIFLLLTGLSFYQSIIPEFMSPKKYMWLFCPFLGLFSIVIFGSYLIAYSLSPKYLLLLPIFSAVFIIINYRKRLVNEVLGFSKAQIKEKLYVLEILLFLSGVIAPVTFILSYPAGILEPSTPFRVGPDAALYSYMAQYLIDGGTWLTANNRNFEYEGMDVGLITMFSNSTMDWPFLYFYRWGLVSLQICNMLINGLDHAFKSSFTSMLLPHFLMMGLIFYWLKEVFKMSTFIAILGAIGFIFNVNILNLWFEGFYGNMFSLCLYSFLYLLIALKLSIKDIRGNELIKTYSLTSFLFSVILLSYGEGLLFVIPCLLFLIFLYDAILGCFNIKLYFYLGITLLISIIIVFPCQFLIDWFIISLKQTFQEGGNGYPQPYWASLNEILGFNNIYKYYDQDKVGFILKRTIFNNIINICSSIAIVYVLFNYFNFKKKTSQFYLVTYLLLIIFGFLMFFKNPANNYGFMKMYVFLLPILFVYFWVALDFTFTKHKNKLLISATLVILLNGFSYLTSYSMNSFIVSNQFISEHQDMKNLKIRNAVVLPLVSTDYITVLPSILSCVYFTNAWDKVSIKKVPQYSKFLEDKIYLLIEKNLFLNHKFEPKNIIYEGPYLMVIDSGYQVRDSLEGDLFDFNKINGRNIIVNLNINHILPNSIFKE